MSTRPIRQEVFSHGQKHLFPVCGHLAFCTLLVQQDVILCIVFLTTRETALHDQLTTSQLFCSLMFPSTDTQTCSAEKQTEKSSVNECGATTFTECRRICVLVLGCKFGLCNVIQHHIGFSRSHPLFIHTSTQHHHNTVHSAIKQVVTSNTAASVWCDAFTCATSSTWTME